MASRTSTASSSIPTGTRTTPGRTTRPGSPKYKKPYEAYAGTVVPEFSDMTTDTLDWMRKNAGVYQPMYDKFGNDIIALQQRGDVQQGNVEDYMNPYINNVEKRAIANAQRPGSRR
jgi:hypothetical protein